MSGQQYPDPCLLIATGNFEFVLGVLAHVVRVLFRSILCTPGAVEGEMMMMLMNMVILLMIKAMFIMPMIIVITMILSIMMMMTVN